MTFIPSFPKAGWLGARIRHRISRTFRRPPRQATAHLPSEKAMQAVRDKAEMLRAKYAKEASHAG